MTRQGEQAAYPFQERRATVTRRQEREDKKRGKMRDNKRDFATGSGLGSTRHWQIKLTPEVFLRGEAGEVQVRDPDEKSRG
jgi:hypothetical protein